MCTTNPEDKSVVQDGSDDQVIDERLAELIKRATPVMGNPIALYIVECAPTPKAADEYVKSLHWPNTVALQVRALANLRRSFGPEGRINIREGKTAYETLVREAGDPSNFMCDDFIPSSILGVQAAGRLCLGSDSIPIDCEEWPYLLRELKPLEPIAGGLASTVSAEPLSWPVARNCGFDDINYSGPLDMGDGAIWNHMEDPDFWHCHIGSGIFLDHILSGGKENYSIILGHKVCRLASGMPAIYKKVTIYHCLADPGVQESLSVVSRLDQRVTGYGSFHDYGAMTYERRIYCEYGRDCHADVVLTVPYLIEIAEHGGRWEGNLQRWSSLTRFVGDIPHAFVLGQCTPIIRIFLYMHSNREPLEMDPELAAQDLAKIQAQLFKNQNPVDLEPLIGETFLETPPPDLLQLLL